MNKVKVQSCPFSPLVLPHGQAVVPLKVQFWRLSVFILLVNIMRSLRKLSL